MEEESTGQRETMEEERVKRTADYVLVYDEFDFSLAYLRDLFESALKKEGLELEKEQIDEQIFLKIFVPSSRLAVEAERLKLEMPLKGVSCSALL